MEIESEKKHEVFYKCFDQLFFLKKTKEVFVNAYPNCDTLLVFNLEKQCYYLIKDPLFDTSLGTLSKYTVDKDGFVYRYKCDYFGKVSEVRKYTYINYKFVDTGHFYKLPMDLTYISCICVV